MFRGERSDFGGELWAAGGSEEQEREEGWGEATEMSFALVL